MTAAMGIPINIRKPNPIDAPRRRAAVECRCVGRARHEQHEHEA